MIKHIFIRLLAVSSALFLAGCTTRRSPKALYESVSLGGNVPLKRMALPRGPVSLEALLLVADKNSPVLRRQGWGIVAGDYGTKALIAERWPTLSARGGYTEYSHAQRLDAPSYNGEQGVYSRGIANAGLVLRVPIYTGGRITNEISAANLLQKSARHTLSRSRDELRYNVTALFYAMLAQDKIILSLVSSQTSMETHLKTVVELIAGGKATKVERLRIDVRLADIKQSMIQFIDFNIQREK